MINQKYDNLNLETNKKINEYDEKIQNMKKEISDNLTIKKELESKLFESEKSYSKMKQKYENDINKLV